MGKNSLKSKYDKMAVSIEAANIYDGRGTFDVYKCNRCGFSIVTTYKDKGVTPYTISCKKCGVGTMFHTETLALPHPDTDVINWIRPTFNQFKKMQPGAQEHILNGGLIMEREPEIPKEDPFFPIQLIMDKIPAKESIRIAYIPIVISNAALHYTGKIADFCAKNRMPFIKEVRTIRNESKAFVEQATGSVSHDTYYQLKKQTDEFFYSTKANLYTLYFTVRNEFLNRFPNLDNEYDLYTDVYIAHSLFRYVRDFQDKAEKHMSEVCGVTIKTDPDPHIMKIWKCLDIITDGYTLGKSEIIELALKVISNKIDEHVFSDIEITED